MKSLFDRDVYCIAGLPFDATSLSSAAEALKESANTKSKTFLSTPNLNWLRIARTDAQFRESSILSDLSVADGMAIVLISRIVSLPIRHRVAGSDLFDLLVSSSTMRFYFFGGGDHVAQQASENLNNDYPETRAVGHYYPGFGSVDEMSTPEIISDINQSDPDFVVVSLGALKGQQWILKNIPVINAPIISHLGAVVNFYAKTVTRAPTIIRKLALEWAWRIYQEPSLAKRYWFDGIFLAREMMFRVAPYSLFRFLHFFRKKHTAHSISTHITTTTAELVFRGSFVEETRFEVRKALYDASLYSLDVTVNLESVDYVDSGFLGALLLMRKFCIENELRFEVHSVNRSLRKIFYFLGAEYLLTPI